MVDAATRLTVGDILLLILGILLPPLPVLIKRGCGCQFLLNILLCIIGLWIGGVIHAWYIVCSTYGEAL
ncbi:uncharacterized protein ACA1_382090 [Acanthamoeba castellanii str. Neff]|uniref:Uncharacterized protein n=1 Tax=Acanthamoeba castellanii (strain ATCC 30010 / Neff) TaxID=1257118 RepID=L8GXE2_ACACF|nr:uncharacterized protein ACA1_096020 [Acanthamoeba castellanii str. Neff]XP_004338764.1 uncharacterized protein ACA1_382090 [Acanthamoeba castellanii str. Neff]ELR12942.1 hypothetical protein ACA1_096020 [Acanthamoeba castellanii str. Neff]ELR16751.1 hypothetical protein ACA1_382090 [Acanthamoeba castellanii str. Neff]